MANVRIKDITTTASAPAADDYLAIDGATSGTRKILAKDLQTETDTTLSVSGKAADAAAVGEKVSNFESNFDEILIIGKNLFNGNWTEGYYVNNVTGDLSSNASYHSTDYISIKPNTNYVISGSSSPDYLRYALYDENKTYITGAYNTASFKSTPNTRYIRFSLQKTSQYEQIEVGTVVTEYEPYKEDMLNPALVWSENIDKNVEDKIEDHFPVDPKDTSFFYVSGNLIDPDTIVIGEYVNQVTGEFQELTSQKRTGYIEVISNTDYCIKLTNMSSNSYIRYVFYTENKSYISGAYQLLDEDSVYLVSSPANAKYIVISCSNRAGSEMMIKKSSVKVDFESYNNTYILPEYIYNESEEIIMNLPSKIYAIVGYELNIYFSSLVENWTDYQWRIGCTKGMHLERGFRITPTADDIGTYTLIIIAKKGDISKSVTSSLIITSDSAGSGESKSIIILGDSTTNSGIAITKLNENFNNDVMNITTLGTRGTAPNNHEGRSGWTFDDYFNIAESSTSGVKNPWYNPSSNTFDANYYFTGTGISKPDWFFINLGINDVFNYNDDETLNTKIDSMKEKCNAMIASMKNASENTKIGICITIPPNDSQDAFGKAYGNGTRRYRYKRNNLIWVNALITEYDNRESEDIYLIPIHVNLDTRYNMGFETLPVNARNTDITYESPIGNGGVHPVTSGYWQIADVYTAFLKAQA